MSVTGHISIAREDGKWAMLHNHIMEDHIPTLPRALSGNSDGVINIMGAGTDDSNPDELSLSEMTSTQDSEVAVYSNVDTHGPVINLEESDINVDSSDFIDHSGAIFISSTFSEGAHRQLDGEEIAELALFTGDRDYMFARTIIPESDRIIKLRNQSVTVSWMIFYGVESASITRRDWLGDGYGFMYGQNYGQ